MGLWDLLLHGLNFVAPALFVGAGLAIVAQYAMKKTAHGPGLIAQAAINFIVGVVLLLAGLWFFGRDGKMVTYAVLFVGLSVCQWLSGRHWR